MKTLLFPEIKNFNELFSSYTIYPTLKERQEATKGNYDSQGVMLGRLNSEGYTHLSATIRKELLSEISKTTISEWGLELVQRSDMSTLVCLKYSYLIGSHWLAIIPPEGMPDELSPIPYENLSCGEYITEVHHIQHGHDLDELICFIKDYKTTFLTPESFNLDNDGFCHLLGNFELFSLNFRVKTNDPSIIKRFKDAYYSQPKLKEIDSKRLFSRG